MTCVVGLIQNKAVYMGADCLGCAGGDTLPRRDPKVFAKNNMLIGYTTSYRMGQLLRYNLQIPKHSGKPIFEYICVDFIDAIRKCFADGGYRKKENEVETAGTFLVGFKGKLFEIEDDFQASEAIDRFAAVGSGRNIARAAMFACIKSGMKNPRKILLTALMAAERYNAYVQRPFKFLELK